MTSFFTNQLIDESYEKYIKPNINNTSNFYRVFDNNCDKDRVIINGKFDSNVDEPKNLNKILNIDSKCGNIVHVPMLSEIYIEYQSTKLLLDVNNFDVNNMNISNMSIDNSLISLLSVKTHKNIKFQDILIQTSNDIILVQLYKFDYPIDKITHGAFIIYQNDESGYSQNNTIFFTKNSMCNNQSTIFCNNQHIH